VRPVEAIAELLRITRKYLIMTSLEALSTGPWQRWRSHVRVDVRQPHVERNFFLLGELDAIFGGDWQHENLFHDGTLPVSSFEPAERQEAAYDELRDREALVQALLQAISIDDHRPGAMGILIVKAKPGAEIGPARGDDALARWLVRRTAIGHHSGARLVAQIQNGTAPFTEPDRPVAPTLLALVRCPDCRGRLTPQASGLHCSACDTDFPVEYGVPILYPQRRRDDDRLDDGSLRRLCGNDPRRERIVRRVLQRLRRNERPPTALRKLLWTVDRLLG
jgi:uncharacterized protein YbaR (Trm112 family)